MRRGGHLDDRVIARFVDDGERSDSLDDRQLHHLAGCTRCQSMLRGHRRARALLLRHDPAADLPAVAGSRPARISPAFASLAVVALALVVGAGVLARWNSNGSTVGPSPSEVAAVSTTPEDRPTPTLPATPSAEPTPTDTALSPTPTPEPRVTPEPTPSRTPAPTPAPTPVRRCLSTDVAVAIVPHHGGMPDPLYWEGNMGRLYGTFTLTNISPTPCRVDSLSTPQLINGDGKILIEGGSVAPTIMKTMRPGQTLTALVVSANLCAAPPIVAPVTVGFIMSEGKAAVAPPISPTDTQAVPPCSGDPSVPSGDIYIQNPGWQ